MRELFRARRDPRGRDGVPGNLNDSGVENLTTWAHELVHAADHKLGGLKERGGASEYIKRYCDREKRDPVSACMSVIKRVCEAVNLILETAEQAKAAAA